MGIKATPTNLLPGDVFAVNTGTSDAAEAIRLGAALEGKPNLDNHVAGMVYWKGSVPWGLEGKPGGVGWVDMRRYVGHPMAYNNCAQPDRNAIQRNHVANQAKAMIGTAYDWAAIGGDTLEALHIKLYNLTFEDGLVPGHVVCSSYWAWLYKYILWAHPKTNERTCTPADWTRFIMDNNYHVPFDQM